VRGGTLPTLDLGPWRIEAANVLYALAVLVGGAFYLYRLVRCRLRAGPTARALVWIVLGGGLGANLGGGLTLGYELLTGNPFPVPVKGVSFPGALLGGAVAAVLICHHHRCPLWWACDQAIPALPLGHAIGRLGCLARGCCYGRPTTSWIGLYLPDIWGDWAVRYPTQLLSAAANLLIFLSLLTVERVGRRKSPPRPNPLPQREREQAPLAPGGREVGGEGGWPFDGFLTLLYLGLYLLKRFGVEFLRGDTLPALFGPLNSTHLVCLAGLLLVLGAAGWKLKGATA
jgi:phosphatidylglycerol:prolipoprotein diacylglycerol transferase